MVGQGRKSELNPIFEGQMDASLKKEPGGGGGGGRGRVGVRLRQAQYTTGHPGR